MTITIDATYEQGVLKPSQPLPFREHELVRVTVEQCAPSAASQTSTSPSGSGGSTLADRIAARAHALPPGALDQLPDDLAAQHVPLSLGEQIAALARDLPVEVLESLPTDGASQHDHYIYGTPKRPEPR